MKKFTLSLLTVVTVACAIVVPSLAEAEIADAPKEFQVSAGCWSGHVLNSLPFASTADAVWS